MSLSIIRNDSKAALTLSLFYLSLSSLNINPEDFLLTQGETLTPIDLLDFTNRLQKELLKVGDRNDFYVYVDKVTSVLRSWGQNKHTARVI